MNVFRSLENNKIKITSEEIFVKFSGFIQENYNITAMKLSIIIYSCQRNEKEKATKIPETTKMIMDVKWNA